MILLKFPIFRACGPIIFYYIQAKGHKFSSKTSNFLAWAFSARFHGIITFSVHQNLTLWNKIFLLPPPSFYFDKKFRAYPPARNFWMRGCHLRIKILFKNSELEKFHKKSKMIETNMCSVLFGSIFWIGRHCHRFLLIGWIRRAIVVMVVGFNYECIITGYFVFARLVSEQRATAGHFCALNILKIFPKIFPLIS